MRRNQGLVREPTRVQKDSSGAEGVGWRRKGGVCSVGETQPPTKALQVRRGDRSREGARDASGEQHLSLSPGRASPDLNPLRMDTKSESINPRTCVEHLVPWADQQTHILKYKWNSESEASFEVCPMIKKPHVASLCWVILSLYGWLLLFFLRWVCQHIPDGSLHPQRWLPDGSSWNTPWRTPHAPKPLMAGYCPQSKSQVLVPAPRSPPCSLHRPLQPAPSFQVSHLHRWCL